MKQRLPAAVRQSVEARLKAAAAELGVDPQRLHRELVAERLMARLLAIAPDRWALKGGLALDFRYPGAARTTKDIDLTWNGTIERVNSNLTAARSLDLGDYFSFLIERAPDAHVGDTASARYRVNTQFAGRPYVNVVVDIGFRDAILWQPDLMETPVYLRMPDVEPVTIPTIPLEQHVAEKAHAYTREYASGPSSRVKDLIDLALIATHQSLSAERLRHALEVTFERRASHPLPISLPAPPDIWVNPYRNLARDTDLDERVGAGFDLASRLIDPILEQAASPGASWNPATRTWAEDDAEG